RSPERASGQRKRNGRRTGHGDRRDGRSTTTAARAVRMRDQAGGCATVEGADVEGSWGTVTDGTVVDGTVVDGTVVDGTVVDASGAVGWAWRPSRVGAGRPLPTRVAAMTFTRPFTASVTAGVTWATSSPVAAFSTASTAFCRAVSASAVRSDGACARFAAGALASPAGAAGTAGTAGRAGAGSVDASGTVTPGVVVPGVVASGVVASGAVTSGVVVSGVVASGVVGDGEVAGRAAVAWAMASLTAVL